MIDYGGITLDLDSALHGDTLDRRFGQHRPALDFDPNDEARIFLQDEIMETHGDPPRLYDRWYCDIGHGVIQPRWRGSDEEYTEWCRGMRNALLLPVSDAFLDLLRDLWDSWGRTELRRRNELKRHRREQAERYGDQAWQVADLQAEVEAVCGQGRRSGRQMFYRCPFHEDRTASLEVDPAGKRFHCFGCHRKGGVYAWRRLIKG